MMTKQNFQDFAELIDDLKGKITQYGLSPEDVVEHVEEFCVRTFAADNPRFNEDLFREACGTYE